LHIHVLHTGMCLWVRGSEQGGRFKDGKGWGEANIMQDGRVDFLHGTGVDRNLYPYVQGHHPSLKIDKSTIFELP
jgi:hypothetical protein